jgi:hypothetical protein
VHLPLELIVAAHEHVQSLVTHVLVARLVAKRPQIQPDDENILQLYTRD